MSQDNEGCRSGVDRRSYTYTDYFPERRSGYDRRFDVDRRSYTYTDYFPERRSGYDRRFGVDKRKKQR